MVKWLFSILAAVLLLPGGLAAPTESGTILDSMDQVSFSAPPAKGHVALVPGKVGNVLRFSFDNDCSGVFMQGHVPGSPAWDKAAGFSFWVKGNGSDHLRGIENDGR